MFETSVTLGQFVQAGQETLVMVSIALLFGAVFGTVMGVVLVLSRPNGILPSKVIYKVLNPIINITRSLPFIILLVAILPVTRFIVGSSIGTAAAIVPLTLYISPYIGRLVENSLLEVDQGIIEAADAMGASTWQIIWHFLLPEAKASLLLSFTTATIGLIGATAMAGAVGGGGIGDLALNYGYQRFDNMAMLITVIILVVLVQGIQSLGNRLAKRARRG